jgi:hypothetical protein
MNSTWDWSFCEISRWMARAVFKFRKSEIRLG